jgi:hypothetical protein
MLARSMKVLAIAYLAVAGVVIVVSAGRTFLDHGLRRMLELFSPFNEINWLLGLLLMAPGLALLHWAERLDKRKG